MKIKTQYVFKKDDGTDELGRECWIVRSPIGLAFGTIYVDEKSADDLTEKEYKRILDLEKSTGAFKIIEVIK